MILNFGQPSPFATPGLVSVPPAIGTMSESTAVDPGLSFPRIVQFRGNIAGSLIGVAVSDIYPLAVPSGISAVGGAGKVSVIWNPVTFATFELQHSPNGTTNWSTIYIGSVPKFVDTNTTDPLFAGTWWYRVRTNFLGNFSDYSAIVSASPYLQPTGLTATGGTGSILVTWDAYGASTGFDLQRSSDGGTTWVDASVNQPGLTYTDTLDPPSTGAINQAGYWFFRVRARANGTFTGYTSPVNASPYVVWDAFYHNTSADLYESYQNRGDYRIVFPVANNANTWRIGGPVMSPPLNANWLVSADGVMQGYCGINNFTWLHQDALQTSVNFRAKITIPNPTHDAGVAVRVGDNNVDGLVFALDPISNQLIAYSVINLVSTNLNIFQPLTVSANKVFTVTVTNTASQVSVTATEDANPTNTATITYVSATFGTNTRWGLFTGGLRTGTVNFGQIQMWSPSGKPTIPAIPTNFTLLTVEDAFVDPDGTLVTAHGIAPTNLTARGYSQVYGGGSDTNGRYDIQGNQLRLGGSRDLGTTVWVDGVAMPDGMSIQVDGTFDPTLGSSWGLAPQMNTSNPYSFSSPNAVFELTTFPLNTGFPSLPLLTVGQLLCVVQPGVQPISAQTNGGTNESVNCFARKFFPMAIGSSWRLKLYTTTDRTSSPVPIWITATPLSGGVPSGDEQSLAYVKLPVSTASNQFRGWTGALVLKGGDVPTGGVVNNLLDNFKVYTNPVTGGVLELFKGNNSDPIIGRTPIPTNGLGGTWAKLTGGTATGVIQSGKGRFNGGASGEDSFLGMVSGLTNGTFGTVLQLSNTSTTAGGPCFGFDATGQNGYFSNLNGNFVYVQKMVAGVKSTLTDGQFNLGFTISTNTRYWIEGRVSGTAVTVYFNGVLLGTATLPSAITTNTYAGLYAGVSVNLTMDVEQFYMRAAP